MARITSFELGDDFARPEGHEEDSFDWYGLEVRLNPDFSEVDFMDFINEAGGMDVNDPRSLVILDKVLRAQVHADDYEAFKEHTRRVIRPGKQLEAMLLASNKLMEAVVARPTQQPSDSSSTPGATVTSLKEGSSSQESPLTDMDRRVLNGPMAGRPDIGSLVLRQAERRAAAG
jgi:hypothetical protein